MIGNIFKVLISVKAKLFFGFLSMVFIIMVLGGYAFTSIGNAGQVVKDTYDRPLMAINFARSAGQVFSQLEIETLQQSLQAEGSFNAESIALALQEFKDDLAVAKERSIAERADPFFDDIAESLTQWEAVIMTPESGLTTKTLQNAQPYADAIEENLDIVVELQTNASFLTREGSISQMDRIKTYNLRAVILALGLTVGLSVWLTITIVNPLKMAAAAARKISAGNLDADIPPGGDDETGVLLKTMASMQKNIRDRLGREESLRDLAQNRLSDSLNNSKDAILLTDDTGHIIVANPQMGDIFPALHKMDLIGKPFLSYFEPAGCSLNNPSRHIAGTDQISFADGRWARVAQSETKEGGNLYIWTDITEAKERSINLREAKEAAEAADKAKSTFLAAMSHELRTPLNAVIGFSDILEDHHNGPDGDEDFAEMANLISRSGAQLLNVVKDVLSVAKGLDQAAAPEDMTDVDLNEAVNYSIKTIAGEAKGKNVRLLFDPQTEPMRVTGDILRIQQVLLNLLSNAIKFNDENGAVKVQLSASGADWVRCDIIDTGIGIAQQDLASIMEPFMQADAGHTRKYDGMGLGLTIVKQVVDSHKGRLKIQSKLGKGTAVSLYFPALTEPQSVPVRLSA